MVPPGGIESGVRSAAGAVFAAVSCGVEIQTAGSHPWVCVVFSHGLLLTLFGHSLAVRDHQTRRRLRETR